MYRKVNLQIENLVHNFSIDTLGIVRNETENKALKGTSITKANRYVKIHLHKFHALHRLVAEHFIPNPIGLPQVNHIDGNRHNNTAENLEWVTARTNMLHAYNIGLKSNHGMLNPFRKLTEDQVKQVWALRHSGTARQTRDQLNLNVSIDCIKLIRTGKAWASVTRKLV